MSNNPLIEVEPSLFARAIEGRYPGITVGDVHKGALLYNREASKSNRVLHRRLYRRCVERLGRKPTQREWRESPELKEYLGEALPELRAGNLKRYLNMETEISKIAMKGEWTKAVRDLFDCFRTIMEDPNLEIAWVCSQEKQE